MLWATNEFLILVLAYAAFLIVIELTFRLGFRHREHNDSTLIGHINALQAALLGLLALLFGFTFSMAVTRFDTRKSLVVDEANAIGTVYLRVQLLPNPQQKELSDLLKVYVAQRLACAEAGADQERLDAAFAAVSRTQSQIWKATAAASVQSPTPISGSLFVQAVNAMIDVSETHRVALENHVPEIVIYLLFINSIAALGFIAYGAGLTGKRRAGSTAIFAFLIAVVLTVILDIDRPRRGFITVTQGSMLRLQADMEK